MTSPLGKVSLQDILQKHSLGAEEGAIERDRVTHRVDEAGTISVEKRNDHLVKLVVQRKGVDRSAVAAHLSGRVDGPAGDTFNTAFDPPAIKDAQTGHAIDGGFHTTGARRFQRGLWGVERSAIRASRGFT